MCALQVTGVDGVQRVLSGQSFGQTFGLQLAMLIQWNVNVTLNAGVYIPSRFAMSNGHDARCVRGHHLPCNGGINPSIEDRWVWETLKCSTYHGAPNVLVVRPRAFV